MNSLQKRQHSFKLQQKQRIDLHLRVAYHRLLRAVSANRISIFARANAFLSCGFHCEVARSRNIRDI